MNFDITKFNEMREKTETFYKTIGEVHCPYFKEKIPFNAKGLHHLKFKSRNHARSVSDQFVRFKLIHLAPIILSQSGTIQGITHDKVFEYIQTNSRTEYILKDVSYYEFIAVLNDRQELKRVRVVIKQIENGPKYFWSIIPFWKIHKTTHKRIMNSGDVENE